MKRFTLGILAAIWIAASGSATEITSTTILGPYPRGVQADALDFTFTAAVASPTGATFTCTGADLLIARYTGGATAAITILSTTDEYGRTGTISDYEIANASYAAFWFGNTHGWANSSGQATITCATSSAQTAILRIPMAFRGIPAATTAGAYTPQNVKGPYPGTVSAGDLTFTMAAGITSSATFALTNKEVLLVYNSAVTAHTFTLTSVPDKYQRSGNVTNYSLGAGEWAAFFYGDKMGWADSNGCAAITASNSALKIAVLRIPNY